VTSPGSKRWPPRRRAESVLQDLDRALEELDLHGLVADLGLEVVDEAVAVVGLPRLEAGLHGGDGLVTPLGEPCGGDAELAAERVERLSAEEPQDELGLAAAGPASLVLAVALRRSFFMVWCIVPSSPRWVSQETVQRTTSPFRPYSALLKDIGFITTTSVRDSDRRPPNLGWQ